ncbi:hypothetical protein Ssi03_57540 [Sphaerisporangium siamense]|uniref:DNA-binding MarR family transcriptional regulator n=1 Tax=Sphaerisporangium siamense TaxID=795645 RepID=A0A7W7D4Z3_9ACTN|nr:MarR family transcriptional regulator [Sphaerisporangium siamense]MBB4700348.1 DNA-binding MarR family transcriptional regulator [Sphaerisporangium siamense]GII87764.1 hypothetical protein Ssi03_57540 [Sphaerisporangium siamense]
MSADRPAEGGAAAPDLLTLMRRLTVELDRFAERFASDHGLHRTDLNAVVVIMDAVRGGAPLTPGSLAGALNLSAPATTALLNRLERAGHVERRRSATDRRKVELTLRAQAVALAERFFAPLADSLASVFDRFTDEERGVIRRFLDAGIGAAIAARERPAVGRSHPRGGGAASGLKRPQAD